MSTEYRTPTREDDFDAEWQYALFDDYMERVHTGELSHDDAMNRYLAEIATDND